MKCSPTATPEIDLPALRERYRHERERRMRRDGARQYVGIGEAVPSIPETDPHMPPVDRAPVHADTEVAILGGGFGGIIIGARLKEAGIADVRIIDAGGDFGGVWYWNRYPNVQCDVESYCYMPLLEELGYMPRERFASGAEIFEHCQRIGRHFDLYKGALFGTKIRGLRWDAAIKRWHVTTNRGDDLRARFVVMAPGSHSRAKLPGIPGINSFKGHSFHTARWDYDYTGGAPSDGRLTKLADKRVAVIGTGATAIQVVPAVGEYAKHLYVFQRTPTSIQERSNTATDQAWAKTLQPGWQAERQRNFHVGAFEKFSSPDQDLLCDGWAEVNRNMAAKLVAQGSPTLNSQEFAAMREVEDYKVMERIRQRVDSEVTNKDAAEILKPWYRFMCKRPGFSDAFLKTFNRPNVTLVDVSDAKGVERITEKGLVANGREYEVDCIIYASGFDITPDLRRRFSVDVVEGTNGQSLFDHWADGLRTFQGMMSHGFPNQFYSGYTQAGQSANIAATYDQQGRHIAYIVKETLARKAATVEPSQEAENAWVNTIREKSTPNIAFWTECTPGYLNNEGAESMRAYNGEPYGGGFYAFGDLIEAWRATGKMEGLVLKP